MPTAVEVARYTSVIDTLASLAVSDALRALAVGDYRDDAAGFARKAIRIVPGLVTLYGDAAAGYAADMYATWRSEAGVSGRWRATPAQVAAVDQVEAGLRVAVGPLWGADPDLAAFESLLSGVVARHVVNGARDTIVGNTNRDTQAVGWTRIARAGACRFCRMLAGRGEGVYLSERTARFAAHDNCSCACVPSWDRDAPEVPAVAYVASKRKQTPNERARVKAYLDAHYPE